MYAILCRKQKDNFEQTLTSRHCPRRRFPSIRERTNVPGRLRHLLREDRVRARGQTELRPARDVQQLQPVLPPEAVSVLQVQAAELRVRKKTSGIASRPRTNCVPQIRLPMHGDARKRAMSAWRHVRRKRKQTGTRIPASRSVPSEATRGGVFIRRTTRLQDAADPERL